MNRLTALCTDKIISLLNAATFLEVRHGNVKEKITLFYSRVISAFEAYNYAWNWCKMQDTFESLRHNVIVLEEANVTVDQRDRKDYNAKEYRRELQKITASGIYNKI